MGAMTITNNERGFLINTGGFDESKVRDLKSIRGAGYRGNGTWFVPGHREREVNMLKEKYGIMTEPVIQMREQTGVIPPLPELEIDWPLNIKPFEFQKPGVAFGIKNKKIIIGDQQGLGKAQPLTAKIATKYGWVKMGDIKIGEEILSTDGQTQFVTGVFPQGLRPCYKVIFNDGSTTECDRDHIWVVRDVNRRRRNTGWINKTTEELINSGLHYTYSDSRRRFSKNPILKWQIPLVQPFDKEKSDFVIPPYLLGALLGDGYICGKQVAISIPDNEIETLNRISDLLPKELKMQYNKRKNPSVCPQYLITQTKTTKKNPYRREVERLGINVKSKLKFIPNEYLFGSYSERLDLLRGLMDTDGSAINNRITFHTMSSRLATNISTLVFSLGGQANKREYNRGEKGVEWQVNVKLNVCPFYLSRKVKEWRIRSGSSTPSRYIKSIEFMGNKRQQCISVSHKNKQYITDDFIVTHNTIQAIAMAVALECKCILVICPATLKLNWQEEWRQCAGRTSMILSDRVKSSWVNYHRVDACHIFIVNYESLLKYFVKAGWKKPKGKFTLKDIPFKEEIDLFDCVIVDESSNCKDGTRLKTKLTLGICKGKPHVFCLTGTPVINKPKDLLPQLAVIDRLRDLMEHIPHPIRDGKKSDWSGYNRFLNRYCEGGQGAGNLKELNYRLNALGIFYRREKAEVLKDLPEKMRQVILCEITNRKEYDIAQRDFIDYLKKWKNCTDEQIQRKLRGEMMVKIGVLKQISARGKLEAAIEHIDECIESGEKIVVFAHLTEITSELKQHYNALSIVGDDSMEERQAAIKEFQNNPDRKVIICSKAAEFGVTLTASFNVLFVEFPWTFAGCEQMEDRVHRISQTMMVICKYLLGENTIDRYCYELIQKKKSIHKEVTGSKHEIQDEIVDELLNLFNQQ